MDSRQAERPDVTLAIGEMHRWPSSGRMETGLSNSQLGLVRGDVAGSRVRSPAIAIPFDVGEQAPYERRRAFQTGDFRCFIDASGLKWTPFPGQFGGWNKLGSGSCHAANLIRSSVPP